MADADDKTSELIAKLLSEDNAYGNYYDQDNGAEASEESDYEGKGRRKKAKKGLMCFPGVLCHTLLDRDVEIIRYQQRGNVNCRYGCLTDLVRPASVHMKGEIEGCLLAMQLVLGR